MSGILFLAHRSIQQMRAIAIKDKNHEHGPLLKKAHLVQYPHHRWGN